MTEKKPTRRAKKRRTSPNKTSEEFAVPQTPVVVINDPTDSIEFSRDAKGKARWTIKSYGSSLDQVLTEVMEIDRQLREETQE